MGEMRKHIQSSIESALAFNKFFLLLMFLFEYKVASITNRAYAEMNGDPEISNGWR